MGISASSGNRILSAKHREINVVANSSLLAQALQPVQT